MKGNDLRVSLCPTFYFGSMEFLIVKKTERHLIPLSSSQTESHIQSAQSKREQVERLIVIAEALVRLRFRSFAFFFADHVWCRNTIHVWKRWI